MSEHSLTYRLTREYLAQVHPGVDPDQASFPQGNGASRFASHGGQPASLEKIPATCLNAQPFDRPMKRSFFHSLSSLSW